MLLLLLVFVVASVAQPLLWPQVQSYSANNGSVALCSGFFLSSDQQLPAKFTQAAARYWKTILFPRGPPSSSPVVCLPSLDVILEQASSDADQERYEIFESDRSLSGTVRSFRGFLWMLETFAQLVSFSADGSYWVPQNVSVSDWPRFAHRGLMIDSARHFLSVDSIKAVLDSMPASKLNVLHWHLTDAQSFPLFVTRAPFLSQSGSFSNASVYLPSDVADLLAFAADRGIELLPEVDMPGHAFSWGRQKVVAEVLAQCPARLARNMNNFPLNPSQKPVFGLIQTVLDQLVNASGITRLHLGGDEVVTDCWTGDPAIASWMEKNGLDANDALRYFHTAVSSMLEESIAITYWEEVFGLNLKPSARNVTYQIWNNAALLLQVAQSRQRAVYSAGWYFIATPSPTWQSFYLNDPITNAFSAEDASYVVGGEAAAWGETVNDNNLLQTVWPLGLAAAERLWSDKSVNNVTEALPRLAAKICQLNARGVPSGPVAPGTC